MARALRALVLVAALLRGSSAPQTPAASPTLKRLVSEDRFPGPRADVIRFYEPAGYELAWIRGGRSTREALALIAAFRNATARGLNQDDYEATRWAARLEQFRTPASELDAARFDLALTVAALRYVSDLHAGRVNPRLFHDGFDLRREGFDPGKVVRAIAGAGDVAALLEGVEPPFPGYRRTRIMLERYLELAGRVDWPRLAVPKKPVEPGSVYPEAASLERLLKALGDLPPAAAVPEDLYEGELVRAVQHFQRRHGLDEDGRIGAATFKQLNTPLSTRIRQLQLTLERYRWVPHAFPTPPVVVNIPEFRLRALNDSYHAEIEMKVVVGSAYRHRTPVFAGEIKSVVFRPYWDVPSSIQRKELVPHAARDRSYLTKNGYEVVSGVDTVAAEDTTDGGVLGQLRSGRLRLRQVPGPDNALGLVKFLFPNEYNVYMHGTPATRLFSKSRRDFSHGCIRLEKPEALAAWVLRGKPEWPPERIAAAMRGAGTLTVRLDRGIPVLIVYATAVVQENGEVYFFDDIYGHDAALEKVLESGFPYPEPGASGRRTS